MVFRFISRYILHNEQLVDKLAESYPIRKAAQWVVQFFTRNKAITETTSLKQNLNGDNITNKLKKFRDRLQDQLQK